MWLSVLSFLAGLLSGGLLRTFFSTPPCLADSLLSVVDLWSIKAEEVLGEDGKSQVFKVGGLVRSLTAQSLAVIVCWGFVDVILLLGGPDLTRQGVSLCVHSPAGF